MAINLLNIQPHKVSTDLSGYITYIYGGYKTGKTTLATQMDGALLVAFEAGYNALPGVMAQDVTTWGEMKQIYQQLKKPEVKSQFKAVVIDTIDVAADKCKKYICSQNSIEDLGDLGYGKGWTKFKEEFNDVFRGLTQLGYAVFFIGHDKEVTLQNSDGSQRMVVRPAISNSIREVVGGMADIYGYAHQLNQDENSVLTLRDPSGTIECGCRFKYIPNQIKMNYQNLVDAVHYAIDKEAAEHSGQFVTDEKIINASETVYDYNALMAEFQDIVGKLMAGPNASMVAPKITTIVDRYLGKGKKISDTTPDQAEFVYLIVNDIKADLLD